MKKNSLWVLLSGLILGSGLLGYHAWKDFQLASITIEWSTASEIDTAGYNIYRSDSGDSGYIRINPSLIAASQQPLTGGSYSLDDDNLVPGRVYYYILEDIDMNGLASRHGPIEIEAKGGRIQYLLLAILLSFSATFLGVRIMTRNKGM